MSHSMAKDGAWGAEAADWAAVQEPMLAPLFEKVLAATQVGPATKLLDVACGTGLLCVMAAARGAEVAGIDASAGQLAVARERLPKVDFRQTDLEDLPFEDGSFDVVTCCNALQYATDPVNALRQMKRVGRPTVTISIMTRGSKGPHGGDAYADAMSAYRVTPPADAPPMLIFRVPGALEAAMKKVGLVIVADEDVSCDWDYPDLATALRGILSTAPAVRSVGHFGRAAVEKALHTSLEPYRIASGSYLIPHSARYVLAKPA